MVYINVVILEITISWSTAHQRKQPVSFSKMYGEGEGGARRVGVGSPQPQNVIR